MTALGQVGSAHDGYRDRLTAAIDACEDDEGTANVNLTKIPGDPTAPKDPNCSVNVTAIQIGA